MARQFLPVMNVDIFVGGVVDYRSYKEGKIMIRGTRKAMFLVTCPKCSKVGLQTYLEAERKTPLKVIHEEKLCYDSGSVFYTAINSCDLTGTES